MASTKRTLQIEIPADSSADMGSAVSLNQINVAVETSINNLPENIFLEIMQYLPIRDRCRVLGVCKNWNKILSGYSSWRHVDLLEYYLDLNTLWTIVRTHCSPCLLTLKIRGNTDSCNREENSPSDAMLRELSVCCEKLRLLHLYKCKTSSILFDSLPPSITCLEMVNNKWQPRWMKDKQMHLPKLKHLILDLSVHVNDFDIEDIAVWKNLKYLSLKGCYLVGISGIKTIAENLLELEFLNLFDVCINDLAVYHIVKHLKKLKELNIARNIGVTDRAVAAIAMGLPVLNKLDISYCRHITSRGLESLFASKLPVQIVERSLSLSERMKQIWKSGLPENFVLIV